MVFPTAVLQDDFLKSQTVGATGAFSPTLCFVGLAQGVTQQSPTSQTTAADLAECTGSLRGGQTLGPVSGPYPLNDGSAVLEGDVIRFSPSTSLDNQEVQAWWIANGPTLATATLLAYELLDSPVILQAGGDPLSIVPRLSITPTALGSVSKVFDG